MESSPTFFKKKVGKKILWWVFAEYPLSSDIDKTISPHYFRRLAFFKKQTGKDILWRISAEYAFSPDPGKTTGGHYFPDIRYL